MDIYAALNKAMADVGPISKEKTNSQQGFKYRGIDDVLNAIQPVFAKYQIVMVPEVLDHKREERTTKSGGNLTYSILTVKYTFYAGDGSSVCAVVIGEGMDSADKSSNKAMSAACKYACFQVLCIPTEEMKDPDADTPPPSTPVKKEPPHCVVCGTEFKGIRMADGTKLTAEQVAAKIAEKHGRALCKACQEVQDA